MGSASLSARPIHENLPVREQGRAVRETALLDDFLAVFIRTIHKDRSVDDPSDWRRGLGEMRWKVFIRTGQ